MSKKKIYISLPITGRDFDEVESEILYVSGVLEMKGYRVVTPIDFDVNPDLDKPYHELLGNDIKALMECDEVCLCPGWKRSKGCQLEHFVAQLWDKEIIEFERLKCCINILFAKQYIVFTADKYKMGKFGSGYIRTTNKAFLQAAIEVIEEIDSHLVEVNEKN